MFAKACELGLEGIVSKRAGSFYKSGKSRNWLKTINPDFVGTGPQIGATYVLFPGVNCRKHMTSAARLMTEYRACTPGCRAFRRAAWKCRHAQAD